MSLENKMIFQELNFHYRNFYPTLKLAYFP